MKTNHGGWKKSIFSRHFLQQSIAFFQQLLKTKKHETCSTPYPLKSSIIGGILHQENPGNSNLRCTNPSSALLHPDFCGVS